jgi:hypothetical protein
MASHHRLGAKAMSGILGRDCPGCGNPIRACLNYRELGSPIGFGDVQPPYQVIDKDYRADLEVVFQPATVLRGLVSGVKDVDLHVGGLKPGWFSVFTGTWFPTGLAERYCFQAGLPPHLGGLGATAVFIDAGNSFDPYFVAALARLKRCDPDEALDRIIVSRAFTCYELASLVSDLPKLLDRYDAGLAVVSDVVAPFNRDVRWEDAESILRFIRGRLIDVCGCGDSVVVTTARHRNRDLETLLFGDADMLVDFKARGGLLYASLLRHPFHPLSEFRVLRSRGELTLDTFVSRCVSVG